MPSEREFISQRFTIVKQERDKIDRMMVDAPHKVDNRKKIDVRREYRLLGKILAEVPEDRILETLQKWREKHKQVLQDYLNSIHKAQLAAERYWDNYDIAPDPFEPPPGVPRPGIKIMDNHGYIWIIDAHYIRLMDRLIDQLQRWLAYEEA